MMRVVFLLFAEERGLLPSGELFDQGYGITDELDRLDRPRDRGGRGGPRRHLLDLAPAARHQPGAVGGASFENLRMPAYGGSLFDPDRFPFLTATTEHGTLAVTVSDRVMLHVLRSVQIADVKGEARDASPSATSTSSRSATSTRACSATPARTVDETSSSA